jgi:hypothetical protein
MTTVSLLFLDNIVIRTIKTITTFSLRAKALHSMTSCIMHIIISYCLTPLTLRSTITSNLVLPDRRRTIRMLVGTILVLFSWHSTLHCHLWWHVLLHPCTSILLPLLLSSYFLLATFMTTRVVVECCHVVVGVSKRLSDRRWMI